MKHIEKQDYCTKIAKRVGDEIGILIHYDGAQTDANGEIVYQQFTIYKGPEHLIGATFVVVKEVNFNNVLKETKRFIKTFEKKR